MTGISPFQKIYYSLTPFKLKTFKFQDLIRYSHKFKYLVTQSIASQHFQSQVYVITFPSQSPSKFESLLQSSPTQVAESRFLYNTK